MRLVKNPVLRHLLFVLGILFVILGVLGIFIPLWPTTPFLLMGAWCFFRSSPRAYHWLLQRRYLGPAIINWEKNGAIANPVKLLALVTIGFSLGVMWSVIGIMWMKVLVTAFLSGVSIFIITRPSR